MRHFEHEYKRFISKKLEELDGHERPRLPLCETNLDKGIKTPKIEANNMILNDENTWPDEIVEYLEEHDSTFRKWEECSEGPIPHDEVLAQVIAEYESAIEGLRAKLSNYELLGYHCSRLTASEIDEIITNGMLLLNKEMLSKRIQMLHNSGLIEAPIAERLQKKNQADAYCRAGMLWFCFSTYLLQRQSLVGRLFSSWGGEALYRSHERDPETDPILRQIGIPCIVEAEISISTTRQKTTLCQMLARQSLINRKFLTREPVGHEDCTLRPVPASSIKRIIKLGDSEFECLTRCSSWSPQLS